MSNSAFTRASSVTESERPIHSSGGEMLSANRMPAANSASGDGAQQEGFVKHSNYVGTAGGTPSGATP
jgi:hypothetical protein